MNDEMVNRKPSKAIVIIDVKDFPKNCPECVFCFGISCVLQGEVSILSTVRRPEMCPLMTAEAYEIYMDKGA